MNASFIGIWSLHSTPRSLRWHSLSPGCKITTTYHHAPSSTVTASLLSKLSVEKRLPTSSTKCYYQQSPHFLDTTSPGDCSFRQRSPQHPWKRDSTPGSRGEQIKPQYYCRSRQPVTFDSSTYLINSTILDPPPQHARTAAVYTRKAPYEDISHLATSGSHSL